MTLAARPEPRRSGPTGGPSTWALRFGIRSRSRWNMPDPLVGVIMGSDSDWPVMSAAAEALAEFAVPYEVRVVSAHRTPRDMLDYAAALRDLSSPPGNRLEALKGTWGGFHSIRVNDQWRIVFRWTEHGPEDVDVVDYH